MVRARGGKDRPSEETPTVKPRAKRAASARGAGTEAAKPEKRPARARKAAVPSPPKAQPKAARQPKAAVQPKAQARPKAAAPSKARAATEGKSAARRPRATRAASGAGPRTPTRRAKDVLTEAIPTAVPRADVRLPEPDVALPESEVRLSESDVRLPVSHGPTRIRLLARNPEWLFAHWNVDPEVVGSLGPTKGPAAINLVLRLFGPGPAGPTLVHLPAVTRTLYVRADHGPGKYRAELGLILASGQFVRLADSNIVSAPRSGPSSRAARRRVRVRRDRFPEMPPEVLEEIAEERPRPDAVPGGRRGGGTRPARTGVGVPGGSSELFRAEGALRAGASRNRAGGSDLNRR
jgi:uncharacterized protein DUF4912